MAWTDEKIDLLRQLWRDGRSCTQIAFALGDGLTRNAVIGKVHRFGLGGRVPGGSPVPPKPRREPKPRRARLTIVIQEPVVAAAIIESLRVDLVGLNQGMCKWPVDKDCYCGNPAPWRAPYCAHHAGLSYLPLSRLAALR